jgi:hypothetical protein
MQEAMVYTGVAGSTSKKTESEPTIQRNENGDYVMKREIMVEEIICPEALDFQIKNIDLEIQHHQGMISKYEKQKQDIIKILSNIEDDKKKMILHE